MVKDEEDIKVYNMRMPRDTWLFLKKTSAEQGIPMSEIILRCIERYRKKLEKS